MSYYLRAYSEKNENSTMYWFCCTVNKRTGINPLLYNIFSPKDQKTKKNAGEISLDEPQLEISAEFVLFKADLAVFL